MTDLLVPLVFVSLIAWLLLIAVLEARVSWIYGRNPSLQGRPRFFTRYDGMSGQTRLGATPGDALQSIGFLYSGRHRDIGDPLLSALVWTSRVMLPTVMLMMIFLFATELTAGSAAQ